VTSRRLSWPLMLCLHSIKNSLIRKRRYRFPNVLAKPASICI
jgi:hypothetical protein